MRNELILLSILSIITWIHSTELKVFPKVNCISKLSNDNCVVFWGYFNKWKDPFGQIEIPHGDNNKFYPLPTTRTGQPIEFIPGVHFNVFQTVIKCSDIQKWTLKGNTASTSDYNREIYDNPNRCLGECSELKCHEEEHIDEKKCHNKCDKDCPKSIKDILSWLKLCKDKCKKYPSCKKKCYDKCNGDCPKNEHDKYTWINKCKRKCDHKCKPLPTCEIVNKSGLGLVIQETNKTKLHVYNPIELPEDVTPQDFYSYNTPDADSVNSGIEDQFRDELRDRIWITPLKHKQNNEMYMMIVSDVPKDGSGGEVSYKITTDTYWPNESEKNLYWPVIVKDDPKHTPDKIKWNVTSKTLDVESKWFDCCTDGIVFGGIHGCFDLQFTKNSIGVVDKTIVIVEYRNNSRVLVDTGIYPKRGARLRFCPGCNNGNCHGGYKPCRFYDRCGTCNGDNSTCPHEVERCEECAKLKVFQKTQCAVNVTEDDKFLVWAEGAYFPNKTTVEISVKCKNQEDTDILNQLWEMEDKECPNDPHNKLRIKSFHQKIDRTWLYKCYGSKSSHHDHESVIKGIIDIKSFGGYNNTLIYEAPCKFNIHSKTCGIASVHFNIHHPTCDMKLLKQQWCSPKDPKNLLVTFATSITKPHGKPMRLVEPEVISYDENNPLRVEFLPPINTTCLRGHYNTEECKQVWTIRTKYGDNLNCFNGEFKFRFRVESECPKNQLCPPKYVKMTLLFKKLCKPTGSINIDDKGFDIGVKGPFCDKNIKGLKPTKSIYAFHRAYFAVFIKGLSKEKCDQFSLKIKTARICFPKDSDHYIESCDDPDAIKKVIWNDNFDGGDWKTIIEPLTDHFNCTSKLLLSFKALLFNTWEQNTDGILEIKGLWNHHLSGNHMNFTHHSKFSDTIWSSENIMKELPSITQKDESFSKSLVETFGGISLKGKRHYAKAWLVIKCPPHLVFQPANECNTFHCQSNHIHGKCVKRPVFEIIESLFTIWGIFLWFIIIIWLCILMVGCCTFFSCSNKKPIKCYSDCDKDNKYHYCNKCDHHFGCNKKKKYVKCPTCKCEPNDFKKSSKKTETKNTFIFNGPTTIIKKT